MRKKKGKLFTSLLDFPLTVSKHIYLIFFTDVYRVPISKKQKNTKMTWNCQDQIQLTPPLSNSYHAHIMQNQVKKVFHIHYIKLELIRI